MPGHVHNTRRLNIHYSTTVSVKWDTHTHTHTNLKPNVFRRARLALSSAMMLKNKSSGKLRYQSYRFPQEFWTSQYLKMKAISSFEMSRINNRAIQRYNPEHLNPPCNILRRSTPTQYKKYRWNQMYLRLYISALMGDSQRDPAIVE